MVETAEIIQALLADPEFSKKLNGMMTDRLAPIKNDITNSKTELLAAIQGQSTGKAKKNADPEDEEELSAKEQLKLMRERFKEVDRKEAAQQQESVVKRAIKSAGMDRDSHAYSFLKDRVSKDGATGKYMIKDEDGIAWELNDYLPKFAASDDGLVYKSATTPGGTGATNSTSKVPQSAGNPQKGAQTEFDKARANLIAGLSGDSTPNLQ